MSNSICFWELMEFSRIMQCVLISSLNNTYSMVHFCVSSLSCIMYAKPTTTLVSGHVHVIMLC
ncbi:uncharacterized protein DS421_3g94990 [Arachis hypogaea]|nr:uncharacterized protein DS421_3g94990 [Arachis hypogaea]